MRAGRLYHFGLWLGNIVFFLILDFAKRLDDLLSGLDWHVLLTNIGVVALVSWPMAALATLLSIMTERLLGLRVVHFMAVFLLLTINLWSLKVGLAYQLENIRQQPRFWMAVTATVLALAATWLITRKFTTASKAWPGRARGLVIGWAVLTLTTLLAAFAPSPPVDTAQIEAKPNIILLTIDSFAAKNTTIHGYERNTTPNLAKFAAENITLDRLHANFNVTGLALPSFNGYLSQQPPGPTLVETLRDAGYTHRAFFGTWRPEIFSLPGFNHSSLTRRGMTRAPYPWFRRIFSEPQLRWLAGLSSEEFRYFNPYSAEYHDDIFLTKQHFPSEISLQAGLEYIKRHRHNTFVWIHLWPPHFPYLPPVQTRGMFGPEPEVIRPWINVAYDESEDAYVAQVKNVYDRSVLEIDRQIGWFLEELRANGDFETSFVVISADHGESFGRGYLGHSGWPLIESITHIPMIFHLPGASKGSRVQTLAQQLDFAPTLLNLIGATPPSSMPGESLLPYFEDPTALSERYKISVSLRASTGEGGQLAVYWKTYKLMFLSNDPKVYRLYDIFKDPEAVHDISAQHPELVKEMMKRLAVGSAGPAR